MLRGSNPSLSAINLDIQGFAITTPNFTLISVRLGVFYYMKIEFNLYLSLYDINAKKYDEQIVSQIISNNRFSVAFE